MKSLDVIALMLATVGCASVLTGISVAVEVFRRQKELQLALQNSRRVHLEEFTTLAEMASQVVHLAEAAVSHIDRTSRSSGRSASSATGWKIAEASVVGARSSRPIQAVIAAHGGELRREKTVSLLMDLAWVRSVPQRETSSRMSATPDKLGIWQVGISFSPRSRVPTKQVAEWPDHGDLGPSLMTWAW